jgi:hypothetical protein
VLHDTPDDGQIYAEIFVDNAMTKSYDFLSLDVGVRTLEVVRQSVGRLTNNFEVSYDCVDRLAVDGETLLGHTFGVFLYFA